MTTHTIRRLGVSNRHIIRPVDDATVWVVSQPSGFLLYSGPTSGAPLTFDLPAGEVAELTDPDNPA